MGGAPGRIAPNPGMPGVPATMAPLGGGANPGLAPGKGAMGGPMPFCSAMGGRPYGPIMAALNELARIAATACAVCWCTLGVGGGTSAKRQRRLTPVMT